MPALLGLANLLALLGRTLLALVQCLLAGLECLGVLDDLGDDGGEPGEVQRHGNVGNSFGERLRTCQQGLR